MHTSFITYFSLIITLMLSLSCILGSPLPSLAPFTFEQLLPSLVLDDDESLLPLVLLQAYFLGDLVEVIFSTPYIPIGPYMVDGVPL